MKKFQLKKPDIKGKIRKIRNLKKEDVIAYWKGRHERRERILEARRNSAFAKEDAAGLCIHEPILFDISCTACVHH